jgi:glycosyltransferase involved in cell wall biosynthesis
MHCPALSELPSPPTGRISWPWGEESPQLPDRMPDGCSWPRISIVTPSFNQGEFIERTIRSVLLQGYPNLEYIIMDGGSTDGSVEIIRKYEPWLTYWVTEADRGQAHAINKGFHRATGEILAWLNSDDEYYPKALHLVAQCFQKQADMELLYGDCKMIDDKDFIIDHLKGRPGSLVEMLTRDFIPQPSAFLHRRAWQAVGELDDNLRFIFDHELWIRMMLSGMKFKYVPMPLSRFRWHNVSKSKKNMAEFGFEYLATLERLFQNQQDERFKHIRLHGHHRAFSLMVAGYTQGNEVLKDQHDKVLQVLEMWANDLEKYHRDYIQVPQIWADSLYRIGQNYCLNGNMRQGRHFFLMALKANKKGYKALIGWVIASLGAKSYSGYTTSYRALFQWVRWLNQQFLPKDY